MATDDSKILVKFDDGELKHYARETLMLSPRCLVRMLKSPSKVYLDDNHCREYLEPVLDTLEASLSPRMDMLPSAGLSTEELKRISNAAQDYGVLKYWQTCVRAALYATRPRLPLHRELQIGLAIEDPTIIVQATWEVSSDDLFRMKSSEIETIGLEIWNRLREVVEGLGLDSYTTAVGPKLQEWIDKGKEANLDSGKSVLETLFKDGSSTRRHNSYSRY
ncbi:hypothetical protein HD553DRAFT_164406 [Filobasidium floriforme]|uniref:uncharacterized protein n=1 Tax=Filobasidium floriforme TaxID=5210 RepID=UPI001E8CA846|nr:uncharacterized protein HD553DRAFT_164406 [Filobasidium floriforme]KAH8089338.1 hypothetical protein HD553DRAFT_164406 [Filobasidium floriforme]